MRRTLAVAVVIAALAAPATAGSAERRIAEGEAYGISTYRGWVMWTTSNTRLVLWRGSPRAFAQPDSGVSGPEGARLGSDIRGRTAVVFSRCATGTGEFSHYRDCDVIRRNLVTGAERSLLEVEDSNDVHAPELDQGALAVTFARRSQGERPSLRLFPPAGRERRLSADEPSETDIDRGRLAYVAAREFGFQNAFWVARAIDLRTRRPRYRTLATHDGRDADGRIPGTTVSSFDGAASDGRHAYWLRADLRDSLATSTFEVWRADLDHPSTTVTKATLERPAVSIAVGGGRIYYTGRYGGGVFEVRDPPWVDTGLTTPVNR
jgi:hypothetical protein